jgi:glycosidase
MMQAFLNPSLYQINTRVWLRKISKKLGHDATLTDITDEDLDILAGQHFDWIYLLGVWQTGKAGQAVSRSLPELRKGYEQALPDLKEEDICGSSFAITGYTVLPSLGGNAAMLRLRARLKERGMRLMLDFIPNHTAPDHPWVNQFPEYYVQGTDDDIARAPQNYQRTKNGRIFAYGRDPYFPGWTDTFQLNYGNPSLQQAMQTEMAKVAALCDGVRCDMAMLVLPEIFQRTWGIDAAPFWPDAIARVHNQYPDFVFMAEVYWDLEWTLQQQGFDYTYDKRLYDRLRGQLAGPVRDHFHAALEYQRKSVRFLENHDEPRAAHIFPPDVHRAAAVLAFLCPGLRFFHQGQLQGEQTFLPIQICRGPVEAPDLPLENFYNLLFETLLSVRQGDWQLLECTPAWESNWTWNDYIVFLWQRTGGINLLVVVNYSSSQGQCYVRLPIDSLRGKNIRLHDRLNPTVYDRAGDDLVSQGLYLDEPAWSYHVFEVIQV